MKRWAWGIGAVMLFALIGSAQAQVAVAVRFGPRPRYVVPVRPAIYPAVPVVYRAYPAAPVVFARPMVVARPVAFTRQCGPGCRAQLRHERREIRAERRLLRREAWEHRRW